MAMPRPLVLLALPLLLLVTGGASAQGREVLCSKGMSDQLKQIVTSLTNPNEPKVSYDKLKKTSDYFVRIAPRKYVLTDKNEVLDSAILSTKPWVFLTTPESIYGKSLLEIYQDIGYEPGDILSRQVNQDMVAVVFRYPKSITFSTVTDGKMPGDWATKVFVPTWDNMFALFHRLAKSAEIDPQRKGETQPEKLFFRSAAEKQFVLGYPKLGHRRIRRTGYAELKVTGGADWVYRKLLEDKLSLFPHFLGTGRTQNVVLNPDNQQPQAGLLEFVGPNSKVKDLDEVAILHLGTLMIESTKAPSKPSSKAQAP